MDRASADGHPRRDDTVAELHAVLLRSAYHELSRRRAQLGSVSGPEFDDLAQHAADDAMVKILAKLEQFAGLSRLTTCAYKFVIFEISGLVSRHARQRESPRADELVWERLADSPTTDPAQRLERSEQLAVLASAVDRLTKRLRPPGDRPLPTPQATQRHRQAPRRLGQGCRAHQRQQRPMPSLRHWPRHSRRSGSDRGTAQGHSGGRPHGRAGNRNRAGAFRRARDRDEPGVKPLDFEALVDSEEPLALTGTFNSARMASASATGSLTGRRRVYPIGTITDISPGIAEIRPAFVGIRSLVEDDEQDSEGIHPGLRIHPSEIGQFSGSTSGAR